tara:strand:+ start:1152 stop:2030 length:879 start_codon:yes stop_codon:yes gene_type:complete
MFSLVSNLKRKKKEKERELLRKTISKKIRQISNKLKLKKEINFLHSGHLGDIVNSLPFIKEIAKKNKCNLLINLNKRISKDKINNLHPSKGYFLKRNSYDKLMPLLKVQPFLNKIDIYKNQNIDINLDLFRDLPINFNIDSVRWYLHITGVNSNLNSPYLLKIKKSKKFKNCIVFMRSLRRQNKHIKFKFLNKYKNLIFIGLYNEYLDLKKQIKNLKFYNCKNFLEMAEIINASRLFIGNLSFGYTLAEGLKKPRLVESYLDFPLIYPNGSNGCEFYFQDHFEKHVKDILKS